MKQDSLTFGVQSNASNGTYCGFDMVQPKFLSVAAVKELSEMKEKNVSNKSYVLQIT